MRIIISGDGDTGTHLANTLSVENQDIILIGTDAEHLSLLDATSNFITYVGHSVSASDLMRCGVNGADLFVAVTNDENVNIVSAQIAKGCGARNCVARVDNPEFLESRSNRILMESGVDSLIYPERMAAREIMHFINHNWVRDWFEVHQGELIVVGVKVGASSALAGRRLKDISTSPRIFHVSSIRRGEEIMIPRGDTEILEGDILYVSVLPESIDRLCEICGGVQAPVRRIMISGGGRITENLLSQIGGQYEIKVIESDPDRCLDIATRFPKVTVVNTKANDVSTIKDEGICNCDMFLALTGSSEKNIVSCMVAREHGVARTIARIEELQYVPEAESLSIDKIINKKLLNVSKILNILFSSDTDEAQCMLLENAEIIELVAHENSKIVSKPIYQLSLPKEITIGGLIRNGKGILVEGRTQIRPGDHVTVFCHIGQMPKVERLFKPSSGLLSL